MSTYPKPKIGHVLNCEDGNAVVVKDGTTPLDGLLTLLEAGYGSARFSESNPAVLDALSSVRIARWSSYTKVQSEEQGVDENWWGDDGQGKRWITVAYYDDDVYGLGDAAQSAEIRASEPCI